MDSRLTKADRQSYGRSISLSDLTSADGVGAAEQGLAAAPQQRLASYVSAPASTLAELRSMPLEHISEDTDAASAPAAATGSPQYATWLHRPLTSGPAMAASQAGKGVSQAAKPPLAAMSPGPRSPGAGGARSPSPNRKQLPRNLRRSNSLIARDHSSDDEEIALCAAGDGLPTKVRCTPLSN